MGEVLGNPEVLFEVGWDLLFPAGDAAILENEKTRFHDLYVYIIRYIE